MEKGRRVEEEYARQTHSCINFHHSCRADRCSKTSAFATRIYAATLICQTETLRQDESRHFYFRRSFFVCSFESEGRARTIPAFALFVVNGPTRYAARYPRFGRRCFV